MQLFYSGNIDHGYCSFSGEESRHIIKVLRMSKGDPIMVTDGRGNLGKGIISETDPAGCTAIIHEVTTGSDTRNYRLHITISPLQNSERLDWFVEKATEIGIDEITPVISRYSARKVVNTARLRRLALSAMKQSLKTQLPVINEPLSFSNIVKMEHAGMKMIAWCRAPGKNIIKSVYSKSRSAVVLIGPEGDFSPEEVSEAEEAGFIPVSLGKSRLRTETAGIIACHAICFMNH
ncbi:MAG: 16S rRNA (uracil(1498)-N(3))-methyltransferase [Bacteroidetes bacterium]|nr:16S rRNA (uracil(1498)-N(3))-methyltransferase [Bacteroidota bacterium]